MSAPIYPNYQLDFGLPPRLDDWVPQDHLVRFLRDVVDALDLAALGFREPPERPKGRPYYSANLMVKAWVFGFVEHFRSTRRLEWACRNVVSALWLTGFEQPDHNTLARFFCMNLKPLRQVFKMTVRLGGDAGLVGLVLHALDGTKITAACSTDTALHRATLAQALARLDVVIDELARQILAEPLPGEGLGRLPAALQDAQARRTVIQKGLATLTAAATDHLHPDEPDARMMRGNGVLAMAYNAQAVADHESGMIVHADVVNAANDAAQLASQLAGVRTTLGATADETAVDAGYATQAQVERVQDQGIGVLIPLTAVDTPPPPADPAQAPPPVAGPYDKARFTYDATADAYECPRGQLLPLAHVTAKRTTEDPVRVYRCHNAACPVRGACSRDPKGRTIHRAPTDAAIEWQRLKQRDPEMQARYARRKVIIEPVFGTIKGNWGFRRFTVRGIEKTGTQWALLCTAFNLRKLYGFWTRARFAVG